MSSLRDFLQFLQQNLGAAAAPGPPPVLQSIAIDPVDPTFSVGAPMQFRAYGTYSDGNTFEVTTKVRWSSSREGAIAVDYNGQATATVAAAVVITAVDPTNPQVTASTNATATDRGALESLEIQPADPSFVAGVKLKLAAIGTFADSSTADLSDYVIWTSSPDDAVSITKGVVAPYASGDVTITATDPHNLDVTVSIQATVSAEDQPPLTPDQEHDLKAEAFADLAEGVDSHDTARQKAVYDQLNTTSAALTQRPTDKVTLKKLVKAGGGKVLDALVKHMPDPPDQATITAAIEARFNITMSNIDDANDKDVEGSKSIKLIYMTLLKVPERNVRLNKSLIEIDREPGRDYAEYKHDTKHAIFPAGRAEDEGDELGNETATEEHYADTGAVVTDPAGHPIMKPAELIDVEDACKPKDKEKPNRLAWAALHEVGHGVDDDTSAMDSEGNKFAGWDFPSLQDVVDAAAANLHYDAVFLKELLTNPKPDEVLKPHDATEEQHQAAVAWCKAVRVDNNLWEKGADCVKFALGDRVFHEAYPNWWVSYNLDARKQGISGYQFRAPGEWFAELYAAYYSGKLKPNHPYGEWIKKF
jgi:hypothetical protein